ncbi:uncharacterized protein [Nicotiana sylvestris]|uniref:uncharacterized protein n=1 Tax=Nicotiana sylvestris TaxID=4096 RepID=UPI00388CCA65
MAYQNPPGTRFKPNHATKNERLQKKKTFTPLGESYTSLFHKLRQLGMLNLIEPKLPNPPPRNLDHSVSCEYCSGAPGHDTERCWHLKTSIQELIDTNRIKVQALEAPNINQNLLPAHYKTHMIELIHKGGEPKKPSQMVMMIRSSKVKPSEKSTSGKSVIQLKGTENKPSVVVEKGSSSIVEVKPEKAKVVVPGVASKPVVVVKGDRTEPVIIKPVTQLPVINNKVVPWNYEQVIVKYKGKEVREEVCEAHDEHRRALMKILNEAHVPDKISVNHLEKITNKIFEVNRVTFSDDELPVEGTKHNSALYLTVKCENSMVTRVLVDNGSSANICPLSTLNKLKVDDDRIHRNSICVRGFDGGGKDSVGDIILELTIGPVEFTMEFQVLYVVVSYNLLLGRPWTHAAKVFDTVSVEKVPEGKNILVPTVAAASVMVAFEILKNGFVPGKGLGASLQCIIQPVSLPKNLYTFGLGFKPTAVDVRRTRKIKKRAWALPKPVPRLPRSFVKPNARKRPIETVPGSLIDVDGDLDKGFKRFSVMLTWWKLERVLARWMCNLLGPVQRLTIGKLLLSPQGRSFGNLLGCVE